jgi:hypothetical protein
MFNNIGFHTEIFTPLSIILLVVGGVLGYGGKFVLAILNIKPTEKAVIIIKLIGLVMVISGIIIILKR